MRSPIFSVNLGGGGGGGGSTIADTGLWLQGGNGYGSNASNIQRRFSNTIANTIGFNVTYTDSATAGGSITINTKGLYAVFYQDASATAQEQGITVNASDLTLAGSGLATNERVALDFTQASHLQNVVGRTMVFNVNDVVRFYMTTDGSPAVSQAQVAIVLISAVS